MISDKSKASSAPSPSRPSIPRRRLRRALYVGLPLLAAGALGLWLSTGPAEATSAAAPPPPTVTVATASEQLLVDLSEHPGRVAAIESVDLRPEVSGRIEAVHFAAGERLEAGQLLFTIDPRSYAAAVAVARAEVARAEARAASARSEAERATALRAQNAISREETELRQARADEAEAQLLSARAALETAQIDLDRTRVTAPIAGRVSRAYVTKGNVVSGGPTGGTVLATLVSTGAAHVYLELDEATARRFRAAAGAGELPLDAAGRVPVELQLDRDEGWTQTGVVESLDNRIDPETGSLTMRLLIDDPTDRLLPGSFVRVRVPVSGESPRLLIGETAIGTDQSQKFVLVVQDDGTVAYRPVTLGDRVGHRRIVLSGLAAGEPVVVNGLARVRPGMPVTVTTEASPATADIAAR